MAPSAPSSSKKPLSYGSVEVIDRYQLVGRLGKGGMAEVFRAKLQSIGGFERDVALKVLLPNFAAEPEFVEMLLDEARIAGSIDHPNVLQVLDVGRKGEIFYLVMEYVDGRDLRTIAKGIPGGRIPLGLSLYVISEMLRGLHAVHTAVDERGQPRCIVHRDISPANVMVDRRGFVKLGDFGIARASGRITRTRVGAVKGKSRYMAPEQLGALPVDHRADLYAVGVTLFEAIMGDFARQSSRPTIYGPMFTWPERLPQGAMPPEVETILRRAMAESPDQRYRTALAFRDDLEVALHRWAPGYGPDTLARELARLLPRDGVSSAKPELDRTHAAPARKEPVTVRPPRWRGVPTAQHTAAPRMPSSSHVAQPVDFMPSSTNLTSPTNQTLRTVGAFLSDEVPVVEGERVREAPSIPFELLTPTPKRRRVGRLGVGLFVAGLALVTVAVAALVAASGNNAVVAAPEEAHVVAVAAPTTLVQKLEPAPTPVATTGTVEVRGPVGASVYIGDIEYAPAPTRVELPPGDYVLSLRPRKKRRPIVHEVRVFAGRTTTID